MQLIKKAMPSVCNIQSAGTSTNGIGEGGELSLIAKYIARGISHIKVNFAKSKSLKDMPLYKIKNMQTTKGISTGRPIISKKPLIQRDKPKPPGLTSGPSKWCSPNATQPNKKA
jgi:hypothetical protein